MAIHKYAQERTQPLLLFAEMGSVNPVIFTHIPLDEKAEHWADQYTVSITAGVGQFCTNPGLLFGIKSVALDQFTEMLGTKMKAVRDFEMLNESIYHNYANKKSEVLKSEGVSLISEGEQQKNASGVVTLAKVSSKDFKANPLLHQEVFGPFYARRM